MKKFAALLIVGLAGATGGAQTLSEYVDEGWWAAVGPDGVQRVNIRCGADFFDPRRIVVKANVPVELAVSTISGLPPHNFVIGLTGPKPFDADTAVGSAQKKFLFVPGVPGDYPILCRDNARAANAMVQKTKQGVLTVMP